MPFIFESVLFFIEVDGKQQSHLIKTEYKNPFKKMQFDYHGLATKVVIFLKYRKEMKGCDMYIGESLGEYNIKYRKDGITMEKINLDNPQITSTHILMNYKAL